MCFLSKIILTDSNLFFYLYAFLGNPQLLIITLNFVIMYKNTKPIPNTITDNLIFVFDNSIIYNTPNMAISLKYSKEYKLNANIMKK